MMSRASFLEVPAHVFGLRLKILRYFRSGWLRARFSSAVAGALAPYPAVSPGAAFLGAGRFIAISGRGRPNNLAQLVRRSLFPPS